MYRTIKSLYQVPGSNIVVQVNHSSKTNEFIEKDIRCVVTRVRGWGKEKVDESSQKVEISFYRINQHYRCTVQHDKYNQYVWMLYMKAVKRVNPKAHHKKRIFKNFFSFVSLWAEGVCDVGVGHAVMSDALQSCGLCPARILYPWDSPGKNIGVDSHSLLQGLFLTQGSNLGALQAVSLPSEPPGNHVVKHGSQITTLYTLYLHSAEWQLHAQ